MDTSEICLKEGKVKQSHLINLVGAYLKNRFPDTKFRLSFRRYPGGKSLKVFWINGPTIAALQEFRETFQGATIQDRAIHREKTFISFHDKTEYASWGIDFILLKRACTK